MSKTSFLKPDSETPVKTDFDPIEALLDPIRSKILFETLLKGKTTAEMLEKTTRRSKSTISHHLKKLVLGEILDVSVSPTGKTKYYQLSKKAQKRGFVYKFDKEAFLKASKKEQAEYIVDSFNVSSVLGHVITNLFSDQVQFLKKQKPFEKIYLDEDGKVNFQIDGKKGKIPIQIGTIVSEDAFKFINGRISELLQEVEEKFGSVIEMIQDTTINPKYLINLQIFPYFIEE